MRTRKSAPTLTERQRRRQIIDLLAKHLACMPAALSAPSGPPGPGRDSAQQNLAESSQNRLEPVAR